MNNRAPEINSLHESICGGLRTVLQEAIQAGELLVAQKKECGHGNWLPWIKTNLRFGKTTANVYVHCHLNKTFLNDETKHLTIEKFARLTQSEDHSNFRPPGNFPPKSPDIDHEAARESEPPPRIEREDKAPDVHDFITALTRSLYKVLAPDSAHAKKLEELLPHTYALPKIDGTLHELIRTLRAIASTATDYANLLESRSPRPNHKIKPANGHTIDLNPKLLK